MENHSLDKIVMPAFVKSSPDLVLTSERVLENLLISECHYGHLHGDYMHQVQEHLLPHHRKIVTDWMLEVCEEQNCSPQVFLSSVQYLDRVLSQHPVKTGELQLLASACLLLSSKLHDPHPLSLYNLVVYTDCSISMPELQSMEMMVLEKLRWELASPTSGQFLSIILANMENILSNQVLSLVQKHAGTFLALAATEYRFYNVKPSLLASVSIISAVGGLVAGMDHRLMDCMAGMVRTDQVYLSKISEEFKKSVAEWINIASSSDDLIEDNHAIDENRNEMKLNYSNFGNLLEVAS